MSWDLYMDFTSGDYLFGDVKLTKITDSHKYKYRGYGIGYGIGYFWNWY